MELNSEHTKLQLSRVTGTAQFRQKYLMYLYRAVISLQRLYGQVPNVSTYIQAWYCHQLIISHYCSLAKPDSHVKSKSLASQNYSYGMSLDKNMMTEISARSSIFLLQSASSVHLNPWSLATRSHNLSSSLPHHSKYSPHTWYCMQLVSGDLKF